MAKAKRRAGGSQYPRVKPGSSKAELEKRKSLFAKEFIANGGNATQAAIEAGYSAKTAYQQGSRLLKDVKIAALIEASRNKALTAADVTVERVLQEQARVAFSDVRKLFKPDGSMFPIHELDDDAAASLASVEVDEISVDKVVIGHTRKVKTWNKNSALEQLMKHLGLYEKHNKQQADALGALLGQVDGAVLRPVQ